MFGRSVGSPAASRLRCQERLWASIASMIASEEPIVAVPVLCAPAGAWNSRPIIDTTRSWMTSVWGYSSWSIMFLASVSTASASACGSIQLVTNEARLSAGLPSRLSSSCTSRYAASAPRPSEGRRYLGI